MLACLAALASENSGIVASDTLQRSTRFGREQRFVMLAHGVQRLVQLCLCVLLILINQVFLEELQTVVITAQLTRVDHRHTRQDIA